MQDSIRVGDENECLYTAFGRVIASDLPLPFLTPVSSGEASIVVRESPSSIATDGGDRVHELAWPDGRPIYRLEKGEDGYVWSCPTAACFRLRRDGRLIEWEAAGNRPADIANLISGPCLGFALQLQGQTCLHGSAVVGDDGAIGFLAPSGYGKSSLAAALVKRGFAFLTDDVLGLDLRGGAIFALPSYPRLKLWPDGLDQYAGADGWEDLPLHVSWVDKRVLPAEDLGATCSEAAPIRCLFLLQPVAAAAACSVEELRGSDSLMGLVAHGYNAQLLAREPEILAAQLETFRIVVEKTPVYRLSVPRDLRRLDEAIDVVLAAVGGSRS